MALTAQQRLFVAKYLVKPNATWAAKEAGYSPKTAYSQGQRLLKDVEIAAEIAAGQQKVADKLEVDATTVLRELLALARTDIGKAFDKEGRLLPLHEMPEEVRRAISGIETDELFAGSGKERIEIGQVRKVKFWDKTKALELLGKHLKLFVEKHEHDVGPSLEELLRESLEDE